MKMTINMETISKFQNLNDNTLSELINHFLEHVPVYLKKMLEAYYLKDFPTVKKQAHLVFSMASTLGADILAEFSSEIELAKDKNEAALDELLHDKVIKSHKEFNLLKVELNKLL